MTETIRSCDSCLRDITEEKNYITLQFKDPYKSNTDRRIEICSRCWEKKFMKHIKQDTAVSVYSSPNTTSITSPFTQITSIGSTAAQGTISVPQFSIANSNLTCDGTSTLSLSFEDVEN